MKGKKRNSLIKVIGIIFLLYVVVSWLVPAGSFTSGEYVEGTTQPVGIFDLAYYPVITLGTFIQYGIVFMCIGGLYGVINKTGVYNKLVEGVTKKFHKKEQLFLIITMVTIAIYASVTGLLLPLFVIFPFLVAIIVSLGYSKLTAIGATFGAMMAGQMGTTYGSNNSYLMNYLNLQVNYGIASKVALLILVTGILVFFVLRYAKKESNKKENVYIPLYDTKNKNERRSTLPLVIVGIVLGLLLTVSMFYWYYSFNIEFFNKLYENIIGVTVGKDYPIFKNILGITSPFGYWGSYEMAAILIFTSVLIGWLYSVKFDNIMKGFMEGVKEMFPVALYVTIANILFTVMLNNTEGNIAYTAIHWLGEARPNFSVIGTQILTIVSSLVYNDFNYLTGNIVANLTTIYTDTTVYPILGLIVQATYGLVMLVAPVSFLLMGALRYADLTFKEWIKYIWKYALIIFILIFILGKILVML